MLAQHLRRCASIKPTSGKRVVYVVYYHFRWHILNTLNVNRDINQQDLKTVNLNFVKSE